MAVHVIGSGVIEQAQAFDDVAKAMQFDQDICLGAMWCGFFMMDMENVGIYNLEPLYDESPVFPGYLWTMSKCHVIDYSKKNIEYLKTKGIEAYHMPYGFHGSLIKNVPEVEKDIDVMFIGSDYMPRRQRILGELGKKCNLKIVQGVYGDELDRLIGRAKVHLNFHHCDNQPLETVRLNYLLANGCNVVSELGPEDEVNELYADSLHFADYSGLVGMCFDAMFKQKNGVPLMDRLVHDCAGANNWLNDRMGSVSCLL